ncbi:MAG: metal ABC transporter ATP-binding protein [Pirellulales bacterium]|nr:metal ABC transporter ATP-binding protein [Pirellulales bacterium]
MTHSKTDSSPTPAISVENVSFFFGPMPVLEQVNFSVARGESISIVGPNGGGKTTLLKLVLGLLHPDEGRIRVLGQSPIDARLRMGYMPQRAEHDLQFPVTVLDVVLMGCLGKPGVSGLFGWHGPAGRRAAVEALDRVGMADYRRRSFAALSGGQRQRVLIARALASRPELLLLDEPTANVDVASETRLLEVLRQLEQEMTIVVVSHDLGFVAEIVRKVICVNRQVRIHPTSQITGDVIRDLYEQDMRMVEHDQHL